jgi:hypothetical protein
MDGRPGYYICAPVNHLWASYPIRIQLDDLKARLEADDKLTNGRWTGIPTTTTALAEWFARTPVLEHLCSIFDDIQSLLSADNRNENTIIYAGPSVPAHLQSATAYPEAMLAARVRAGKERSWADVICPFEFEDDPRRIKHVSLLLIVAGSR